MDEAFRHLNRAAKTRQLYLPNNPIYQRALESVTGAFHSLWGQTEEITVAVAESEFRWEGIGVGHESSKSESLAWLLYKDGLRSLTFVRGVERDELVAFLDILQRVRHAEPDSDDLLTLLWEQDFLFIRYRFVDLSADGLPPIEASDEATNPAQRVDVTVEEPEPEPARRVVRMEDFDPALYFLDEPEAEYIRGQITTEYRQDLRRNVLAILFDIFEIEGGTQVRDEIIETLETLMLQLLSAGEFGAVAYLLREAGVVAGRAPSLSPTHRERLSRLSDRLSVPEVLSQVLRTLDESSILPPADDLEALFRQLRGTTLPTLLGTVPRLQNSQLRAMLGTCVTRIAAENVSELVRLVGSADQLVASEAIRRTGELRTPAAVTPLARTLVPPAPTAIRLASVHALAEIGSPSALKLLEQALADPERDVRVGAIRAIGTRQHRAALPLLKDMVGGRGIRDVDLTEKLAVFEAYGVLAGDDGVSLLAGLLTSRGFFGRREDPEIRACAATALGRIGTSTALAALRGAADDKDVLVRNAINRALRGTAA